MAEDRSYTFEDLAYMIELESLWGKEINAWANKNGVTDIEEYAELIECVYDNAINIFDSDNDLRFKYLSQVFQSNELKSVLRAQNLFTCPLKKEDQSSGNSTSPSSIQKRIEKPMCLL